ncbi:Protein CBG17197 [Caenorhabditis briggsae]|uniref:Uncharacterized protein n=2 Tax=Caenorhabditis briggsae TaxID=6238 RepID=A0AAE9FGE7_CAEBR|nr:Protein CBG17197 [Caenorhabditis briggsae]ULT81370.1 hypothetical protein L3Y34_011334 [Caenorhabditis briggsae]UMM40652.1 hypothetical protein L5515_017197 [Caenorhabditis briggsae]CAP34934.1 Protein CBG17197 [Caenorhabditis briggsae]
MFNLERLLTIICVLLLNLGYVTPTLAEFLQLLKNAEEQRIAYIDCFHSITHTGIFIFNSDESIPSTQCDVTVEVPRGSMVYVRPTERTCEMSSSANISTMCDRPHQEEQLGAGSHHFLFDSTESLSIQVIITPIIRLGCGEWAKNLYELVGSTIVMENSDSSKYCMVQLPPSLKITWVSFETESRKKPCCPDIFTASADLDQNPISYSDSFNACDLRNTRPSVITNCESTFMFLRQSALYDRAFFRIEARPKTNVTKCIAPVIEPEPSDYLCLKKPKSSKKSKSKTKSLLSF